VSAKAPAGKINRKNGSVDAVEIRERNNVDRLILFIVQVAAVSCAETNVPETIVASQSRRKVGLCKALQLEVAVIWNRASYLYKLHKLDSQAITGGIALFDRNDRKR
jgi:hypothetical protein